MVASPQVLFSPFPAQERALQAALSGKYNRLCLAGSIRSGKTYDWIAVVLVLSRIFPKSKWLIVRKDWPRLRSTTMEVFNKLCPSNFVKKKFNPLTREVVFINGSRVIFMNEAPGLNKDQPFRGLYINGAFLDEANELSEETVNAIKSRLGSHKDSWTMSVAKQIIYPPALLLLSCNPNQGWMKEQFYLRAQNGTLPERHFFQNITIRENPYITEDDMKEFADWPQELLNRFIDGSWDALDDENQLIKWAHINQCAQPLPFQPEIYSLGVDVARQGKDKLVYTLMKGDNIEKVEWEAFTENTMSIVARVERFISEYNISPGRVVIDGVGLGAGVVDRLHEKKLYVSNFLGGAAPTTQWGTVFTFKNLKSQAYWYLHEKMKALQLGGLKDPAMKAELASIWVSFDDKVIAVESKDKHKKRTGKSPDFADSLLYACWAKMQYDFVPQLEPFAV
jgi:hypothetical protein